MASIVYNIAKESFANGNLDFDTNTIKALLVTSGYTADKDHNYVSQLTPASNELNGTGYSRKTLQNCLVDKDVVNDRAELKADNLTWAGINAGTAAAVVLFKQVVDDTDSILIAYIDSGGFPITTNGGDLVIQWNTEGIIQLV